MMALAKTPLLLIVTMVIAADLGPGPAAAQEEGTTPGAIPDPSTYQGSTQLQQQQDRQDQQYRQQQDPPWRSNDNARQPLPQQSGPWSSTRRPGPVNPTAACFARLAREPALAPLAHKVQLGQFGGSSQGSFLIQNMASAAEEPLLLHWLAGRNRCMKIFEPRMAGWSQDARRAENKAVEFTNSMIVQLSEGKLSYGKFNEYRAMNDTELKQELAVQ